MKTKITVIIVLLLLSIGVQPFKSQAQEIQPIKLLPPQTEGGKPLMEVLKARKSSRDFSPKELPLQVLSNLLWAANGINRPDSGKRTAPSAMDMQEIDIYVAKTDGLYLYDPKKNILIPVLAGDIRALTGKQPFVADAPVNLILVADVAKMSSVSESDMPYYAAADAAFVSENIYLYCASEGLATVVREWIEKPALAQAMNLRPEQQVIFAQTVGYPKE